MGLYRSVRVVKRLLIKRSYLGQHFPNKVHLSVVGRHMEGREAGLFRCRSPRHLPGKHARHSDVTVFSCQMKWGVSIRIFLHGIRSGLKTHLHYFGVTTSCRKVKGCRVCRLVLGTRHWVVIYARIPIVVVIIVT